MRTGLQCTISEAEKFLAQLEKIRNAPADFSVGPNGFSVGQLCQELDTAIIVIENLVREIRTTLKKIGY